MAEIIPKIALLSTGDELVNGNVLNTNSYHFAQKLFDHFIQPGVHITVNDQQDQIEQGIRQLLTSHSALIISGGLGPTSDDRTRFALSAVIGKELVFNDNSWQRIVNRLNRFALPIPDSNRQQCLFPADAEIYPNENGTADGCRIAFGDQAIFMLPGPPFECMPIFTQKVLPFLLENHYAQPLYRYQWLLLGVSEGSIAALLDPLMLNSNCQVGYRVNQPYLEVKLFSPDPAELEQMRQLFAAIIEEKSVSDQQQKASTQLLEYIIENKLPITINDQATGGLMAVSLLTPASRPFLQFNDPSASAEILITLTGMEEYWQNSANFSHLDIVIKNKSSSQLINLQIPFRKERTPLYATEMACWAILCHLRYIIDKMHLTYR